MAKEWLLFQEEATLLVDTSQRPRKRTCSLAQGSTSRGSVWEIVSAESESCCLADSGSPAFSETGEPGKEGGKEQRVEESTWGRGKQRPQLAM